MQSVRVPNRYNIYETEQQVKHVSEKSVTPQFELDTTSPRSNSRSLVAFKEQGYQQNTHKPFHKLIFRKSKACVISNLLLFNSISTVSLAFISIVMYWRISAGFLIPHEFLIGVGASVIILSWTIYQSTKLYLFWYTTTYEITPGLFTKYWGIFNKRSRSYSFNNTTVVRYRKGFPGNLFNYGTIYVDSEGNQNDFVLRRIPQPDRVLSLFKQFMVQRPVQQ